MKKPVLSLLFSLLMVSAMAQLTVHISGQITDIANGQPVPNHPVHIAVDSTSPPGFTYSNLVYTNSLGYYDDSITCSPAVTSGRLVDSTMDCNNFWYVIDFYFNSGNLFFTYNFQICTSAPQCNAEFTWQTSGLTANFTDQSTNAVSWYWAFGDGYTSTQQNPTHTYTQAGYFDVQLIIFNNGASCGDTVIHNIHVQDTTGGCQAFYTYYADSSNYMLLHFIDQSSGNINSWYWNFGDPASGVNNVSNTQNPIHEFTGPGTYTVCLTVQGADTTCDDTYCGTIVVGNSTGCQADFTSYADSSDYMLLHFVDQSTGNINSWYWNFGDPPSGSNNFSTAQNPSHIFSSPGTYTVCLTVQGADSNCYDTYCKSVYVSDSAGCYAYFSWAADSTNYETIQFTDQSTGNIAAWYWNFGDGSPGSTAQNPLHIYANYGTYQVCLTVMSNSPSCTSTWCAPVTVQDSIGCRSYFTYSANWLTLAFEGHMENTHPAQYSWGFGDGTGGAGQSATHTYAAPGYYTVTMTSTEDSTGCEHTSSETIQVADSSNITQVYGQVFAGSFPLSEGIVMIYSVDTAYNPDPYFDYHVIDSSGIYYFSYVPLGGHYIIWAVPFDSSGGYLPTFYGDVLYWEEATVIYLGTPQNPYNIHLVAATNNPAGPGGINGQVNNGKFRSYNLDQITVLLTNEQGKAVGFRRVNSSGEFDFSALSFGTYYLKPELPNCSSDLVKVVISEANPVVNVIMTFTGNSILGVKEIRDGITDIITYPNPVNNEAHIAVRLGHSMKLFATIYSMTGQKLAETSFDLPAGQSLMTLNVASLNSGIYQIRLTSSEGVHVVRKIIVVH